MKRNGYVAWGTVLGVMDDGRLMIAWDQGNPLSLDASFGIQANDVQTQTSEAA